MAVKSLPQRRNAAPPKPLALCPVPLDDVSVGAFSPTTIPSITYQPASSTSTVNTYSSTFSSSDNPSGWPPLADDSLADSDDEPGPCGSRRPSFASSDDAIPPVLPLYRARPASSVRPSDPRIFASLFPSMDRLSIRHDDQSSDGNMSLRVDAAAAPGSVAGFGYGSRKKCSAVQLFHLRMHDLAHRDFSLRRYGRDSGREVCSARRAYAEPSAVSAALRSVKAPFRRSGPHSGMHSAHHLPLSPSFRKRSVGGNACSVASTPASSSDNAACAASASSSRLAAQRSGPPSPALKPIVATDTIKLEFSNYAHVDVRRCHGKRYEFEWWGHSYAWRRDVDKTLGGVSFHLVRDGHGAPIAHVVPETRSPNQVDAEEDAGGWIPPCYMWISDQSIIDAVTDVADVVVATGLIALVDDSIKERWPKKTAHGKTAHGSRRSSITDASTPRTSFMQGLFHRSRADHQQGHYHHQQQQQHHHQQQQKQSKRYSQQPQPQPSQLRPSHEQRRHSVNAPVFKTPVY